MKSPSVYKVVKLKEPLTLNGNWNKSQWKEVNSVKLVNFMGEAPKFFPIVRAKLMYDSNYIYVIFQVKDCYVRCMTNNINGPVWDDSSVEFFFSPDSDSPEKYFNLETNCGGTALMYYNIIPRKDFTVVDPEDIKQIEIAHSLPDHIPNEITEPVTWTIEYKVPLVLLEKYAKVSRPAPGVVWKANFYKIGDKTSNPHYITWSFVNQAEPDFHLPGYFGTLIFE
jgi:hypothetical protein